MKSEIRSRKNPQSRPYGISFNKDKQTRKRQQYTASILLLQDPIDNSTVHNKKENTITISKITKQDYTIQKQIDYVSNFLNLHQTHEDNTPIHNKYRGKYNQFSRSIINNTQVPLLTDNMNKWKCVCGKNYKSYAALYVHRKNKHPDQNTIESMIKPKNIKTKGRPRKITKKYNWIVQINKISHEHLQLSNRQQKCLTLLIDQYGSILPADSSVFSQLLNFKQAITKQIPQQIQKSINICLWLLAFHIKLFSEDKTNKIFINIINNDCHNIGIIFDIMANWWNCNNQICCVSVQFLVCMLEVFNRWLFKQRKTNIDCQIVNQ